MIYPVQLSHLSKFPIEVQQVCRHIGIKNLVEIPHLLWENEIPQPLHAAGARHVYRIRTKEANSFNKLMYFAVDGPDPGVYYHDDMFGVISISPEGRDEINQRRKKIQRRWSEEERMSRVESSLATEDWLRQLPLTGSA